MRKIRIWALVSLGAVVLSGGLQAAASTSCQMLSQLQGADRESLLEAASRMTQQVAQQDSTSIKAELLPAVGGEWEGIRSVIEHSGPLLEGGKLQIDSIYRMDSSTERAAADSQFYCSNAAGTVNVTLSMRALPPGRYALVLASSQGAKWAGKLSLILAWQDGRDPGWRVGGVMVRPGVLDGHDGRWWWTHAREQARGELAKADPWSAYFSYEIARALLVPVDFLSSANLEKLNAEETLLANGPTQGLPMTLTAGTREWKVDAVRLDLSLLKADLGVSYESTGVTDAAALRTEAKSVMSALLKEQPGLRENFHGLWAYAVKDGKSTPVIELPMTEIP